MTTPLTSEEAEKTLAQLEENKQTRLNRMKRDLKVNLVSMFSLFLAPSGAQGVTMFVRPSVRPVLVCLELNLHILASDSSK